MFRGGRLHHQSQPLVNKTHRKTRRRKKRQKTRTVREEKETKTFSACRTTVHEKERKQETRKTVYSTVLVYKVAVILYATSMTACSFISTGWPSRACNLSGSTRRDDPRTHENWTQSEPWSSAGEPLPLHPPFRPRCRPRPPHRRRRC